LPGCSFCKKWPDIPLTIENIDKKGRARDMGFVDALPTIEKSRPLTEVHLLTRRNFIKVSSLIAGGFLLGCSMDEIERPDRLDRFMMPEEGEAHARTWMSFAASPSIWAKKQIPEVKRNLAFIARTIAKYEPVSMLVRSNELDEASSLLGGPNNHNHPIELIEFATDDLWLRDTGPTFVRGSEGEKFGIDFNFNGWGEKQAHVQDSKVASFITEWTGAVQQTTALTLEGGSFEIDGYGTAILTKSCVLNENRNPHWSQAEIEDELKSLLGLKKIIWLEGIKGKDITDGHTDFYARFATKSEVLVSRDNYRASYDYEVTRENIKTLQNATDADGNRLKVTIIDTPDIINDEFGVAEFAAGYIGYYLCNGAVIMQSFGDPAADQAARDTIAQAFPDRTVEQFAIDGIASGGGSIHCATQQEPQR
jgi:agmatine deiminase